MNATPEPALGADRPDVALCLLPDFDFSDLADLLSEISRREQYAVTLDLCKAPHVGPVEVRTLGRFADLFRRRGGFLRLRNASQGLTTIIRVFRFDDLLEAVPGPREARPLTGLAPGSTTMSLGAFSDQRPVGPAGAMSK